MSTYVGARPSAQALRTYAFCAAFHHYLRLHRQQLVSSVLGDREFDVDYIVSHTTEHR